MKKPKIALFSAALCISCTLFSMSLFSCSDKKDENNTSFLPISEVKQNIEKDIISAKNAGYSNLEFKEFITSFPEIDSYYNLSIYTDENKISIEEAYNNFCDQVKLVAPDHKFDENNIYFSPKDSIDNYKCYSNEYPRVTEYKNDIFSGKTDTWWYMYDSDAEGKTGNDLYLWLDQYSLFGVMIKGKGKQITDPGFEHLNFWSSDRYETVEAYYQAGNIPDEENILADGKALSPSDAVSLVEKFFEDYMPDKLKSVIRIEAVGIELRSQNNVKGYKVLLANKYNDIPFDYEHYVHSITISDDRVTQNAHAFIAVSDEVDYFYNLQVWTDIDTKGNEIKAIVPLKQALEKTSELLTDNIKFEVNDIKFVYCLKGNQSEMMDATGSWKISAYNPNDNKTYQVYVNAETGESNCYSVETEDTGY